METRYIDAHNWYLENQQKLGIYRGEWIAFTSNSVIAHDREYLNTIAKIEPGRTDFVLARVHEYDCWEPPKKVSRRKISFDRLLAKPVKLLAAIEDRFLQARGYANDPRNDRST